MADRKHVWGVRRWACFVDARMIAVPVLIEALGCTNGRWSGGRLKMDDVFRSTFGTFRDVTPDELWTWRRQGKSRALWRSIIEIKFRVHDDSCWLCFKTLFGFSWWTKKFSCPSLHWHDKNRHNQSREISFVSESWWLRTVRHRHSCIMPRGRAGKKREWDKLFISGAFDLRMVKK